LQFNGIVLVSELLCWNDFIGTLLWWDNGGLKNIVMVGARNLVVVRNGCNTYYQEEFYGLRKEGGLIEKN
jgi:hypothetical protein